MHAHFGLGASCVALEKPPALPGSTFPVLISGTLEGEQGQSL